MTKRRKRKSVTDVSPLIPTKPIEKPAKPVPSVPVYVPNTGTPIKLTRATRPRKPSQGIIPTFKKWIRP